MTPDTNINANANESFRKNAFQKDRPESRNDESEFQVGSDDRSIYIKNVGLEATPELIDEHFQSIGGEILRMTLIYDKSTGHVDTGYGYVEFDSVESRDKALSLNGTEFLNHELKIAKKRSKTTTAKPNSGRRSFEADFQHFRRSRSMKTKPKTIDEKG